MNDLNRDKLLFQKIKKGDGAAFEKLFNLHYKSLCHVAYRVYQDEHKSKDFVQDVFLSIWKRRGVLDIKTSVYAYLRKAVMYKCLDHIRAQKINFTEDPVLDSSFESPDLLVGEELKSLIHKVVDQLPNRCRLIFCMSRFEEMSHKEIAAKLEISNKTIENQITKALKILRLAIIKYGLPLKVLIFFAFWLGGNYY